MRIAVASGKGGTGKTTIAVNLAYTMSKNGEDVVYVDCDVEEPNGHLFLKPAIEEVKEIGVLNPAVDETKCDGCGECGKVCRFSAIVVISSKVLTFPELCHGCGACSLVCPKDAVEEIKRPIGVLETGTSDSIGYIAGRLNIREAMPVPLIAQVKKAIPDNGITIIDAPPGTSCPVIEAVKNCGYVILVTEPTPFGINDLKLAVDMVKSLDIPFGVVVNRAEAGDNSVQEFCALENIEVIYEIPNDRLAAEKYSQGDLICVAIPDFMKHFKMLSDKLMCNSLAF
ncbi:ATP-binding protein [bacterium]|nr:ATP-binding protein [bacterium]